MDLSNINQSIFVSASAGSGKTKILIDRLLILLLKKVTPSKILCLAFTKAASYEINDRITKKLAFLATCSNEELCKELEQLSIFPIDQAIIDFTRTLFTNLIDSAEGISIQTIHSFAQSLLLKFPLESGIGINFKLLTGNSSYRLIMQSKDQLIKNIVKYDKADEAINYLSWHIKEATLNELVWEIIANREELDRYFSFHPSLEQAIDSIDPNIHNEEEIIQEFLTNIPISKNILDIIIANGSVSDRAKAQKLVNFLSLDQEAKIANLKEYFAGFLTAQDLPLKNLLTKKPAEEFPEILEVLINEQQRVYKFNHFLKSLKAINLTKAFITLSYHLRNIYSKLKQDNNSLDFDDLIQFSCNLLQNNEHGDWIRYKLDGGIEHVLVDEAQDTSANQWRIIDYLTEEFSYHLDNSPRSLFIVGDSKQSIFSFQGAKPEIFNQRSLSDNLLKLNLHISYRSGKEILEYIDRIFNQPHLKDYLAPFESEIFHKAYKNIVSNVEIMPLVIAPEIEEIEQSWILPSNLNKETQESPDLILAKQIAHKIKNDLDKQIIKNPGDILILNRRRTNLTKYLIDQLRQLNIPTSGLDRLKLLDHPIILDLIALTEFILFNNDDFNLAIVLKSPIFNLKEEDLFNLCHQRQTTLWEKIKSDLNYRQIHLLLEEFINLAKEKTCFEFFFILTEKYQIKNKYFSQETSDIIDAFFDLVREFEQENISFLQLFLEYIQNAKTEIKREFTNSNQVRIMTIHNAKGLQAKVVFLTDTTSLPTNKDSIIWLDQTHLLWPGKEKYYPLVAKEAKLKKEKQEYAEYIRLLYVALTRAEERLIICGHHRNEEVPSKSWYGIISGF